MYIHTYIYISNTYLSSTRLKRARKKTKAELNKTKGSKRDGRVGWRGWSCVCATVSERGLFKEATCVRETRELVCRLPTDKSVARAFFNCVPPTPAPCPPPFNSSPTDTFHVAPLFLFFYFSSSLNLFYRNKNKIKSLDLSQGRERIVVRESRSKEKEKEEMQVRGIERVKDEIEFYFPWAFLFMPIPRNRNSKWYSRDRGGGSGVESPRCGYSGRFASVVRFSSPIVPLSRPHWLFETMTLFLFTNYFFCYYLEYDSSIFVIQLYRWNNMWIIKLYTTVKSYIYFFNQFKKFYESFAIVVHIEML